MKALRQAVSSTSFYAAMQCRRWGHRYANWPENPIFSTCLRCGSTTETDDAILPCDSA